MHSDVKHSLVSSVPGEAAQQACHGAVPLEWEASLLFFHPHPPLPQHWSCGSTENEGKSNANSYWQTFWLLLCATSSKHVFEMVKCLEDGTAGAEEPGALYAQDLMAAEWFLNPSNLNSWPRNQAECWILPNRMCCLPLPPPETQIIWVANDARTAKHLLLASPLQL